MENANITREIFQSHRAAVIQSFVAEMKIATITEFQPCTTILVRILKKRSDRMKDIEEIKRMLSYVKKIDINTYSSEITVGNYKGSVVFSNNERGYEHVSFCPYNGRLPDWNAMCELKDAFFDDEEEAYQIMPKKSEYANIVDNCLHLWRPHNGLELGLLTRIKPGKIISDKAVG